MSGSGKSESRGSTGGGFYSFGAGPAGSRIAHPAPGGSSFGDPNLGHQMSVPAKEKGFTSLHETSAQETGGGRYVLLSTGPASSTGCWHQQ